MSGCAPALSRGPHTASSRTCMGQHLIWLRLAQAGSSLHRRSRRTRPAALQPPVQARVRSPEAALEAGRRRRGHQARRDGGAGHRQRLGYVEALQREEVEHQQGVRWPVTRVFVTFARVRCRVWMLAAGQEGWDNAGVKLDGRSFNPILCCLTRELEDSARHIGDQRNCLRL